MREAFLFLNSATSADIITRVSKRDVNRKAVSIKNQLESLGPQSFNVETAIDLKCSEAEDAILKYKKNKSSTELLLFYYFGHAIKIDHDLKLVFNDSDINLPGSFMDFSWVAEKLFSYASDNIVFIIDCCYSGTSNEVIATISHGTDNKYAVMSSTKRDWSAGISHNNADNVPFGYFSNLLFDNLRNPDAIDGDSRNITFRSLYNHINSLMTNPPESPKPIINNQKPQFDDWRGLGDNVFVSLSPINRIPMGINWDAPIKSDYRKIRYILNILDASIPPTEKELYEFVKNKMPSEFTVSINRGGVIEKRLVTEATFFVTIEQMRILELINLSNLLELTALGRDMLKNNFNDFNNILFNQVSKYLDEMNLNPEVIERAIAHIQRIRSIPTSQKVYDYCKGYTSTKISKVVFTWLLNLLAYTGYLRTTGQQTFYQF